MAGCTRGYGGRPCGKWRACEECAYRRSRDQSWCIRESARMRGGEFLLLTVTAPGDDVLPRDARGLCCHLELGEWCATMMERWNRLNMTAHNRTRRAFKGHRGSLVLASAWQLQRRGAPHIHLAVSAGDAGRHYASVVKEIAGDYGYGFVDIGIQSGSAPAVARYLSRYLTEKRGEALTEFEGYLPSRRVYVSRTLQKESGATMGVARRLRRLWVYANVDRGVGLPTFENETQKAWVYFWFRVGRHGLDNVRRPVLLSEGQSE